MLPERRLSVSIVLLGDGLLFSDGWGDCGKRVSSAHAIAAG
jgi:hypothetical protein